MNHLKKMASWLKSINLAHALILGLVCKSLISDISYAAFLLSIPVLAFEAYKIYIKTKTVDPVQLDTQVRQELDGMKSKLNAMTMEKGVKSPPAARYF